jgi:2-keto-4-pentenoate hydratase
MATPATFAAFAEAMIAARRKGVRIPVPASGAPQTLEDAFVAQELAVAALASPITGWKVIPLPSGDVIFAPLLASGVVPAGGTWKVAGGAPAGIELEIAFQMGADVAPGASASQILDCIASAHVVYELCQSRFADPDSLPQHIKLADCILNAGLVLGPKFDGWRTRDLKNIPGRLLVDGKVHKEGKSVDPIQAIQVLASAMAKRGKKLAKGQTVITGSLIGMNWLTGKHQLKGVIDGCGEVALTLDA